MKRLLSTTAIASAILLASVPSLAQSPAPSPTGSGAPVAAPAASGAPLVVPLNAQNGSGETGSATLQDTSDGVVVVLAVAGGNAAGPQPVHIHQGSCAKLGDVKYPLKSIAAGASSTTVPKVTIAMLQSGVYAINVHQSTSAVGTYVACGNLAPTK
jgi:Cu/Zn superoxide dismutase